MDAVSAALSNTFLQAVAKIQGTPTAQVQQEVQQAPEPPKPAVETAGQTSPGNGTETQTSQNGTKSSQNVVDLTV